MKKIGIITLVHVRNIGAGLQAYAMQHLLNQMDCETVFLKGYSRKLAKQLISWDFNIRFPSILKPKNFLFNLSKFLKFEKSFFKFKECKLNQKNLDACDHIILGSDSIWMPKVKTCPMDPTFFGGFSHPSISSYAASSGGINDVTLYSKKQLKPLKKLKYITVRDESAQKIVSDSTGRDSVLVLDPTLLVDWYTILQKEKMDHSPMKEPYLLLYGWFDSPTYSAIRKYAKKHHLKTVNVGLQTGGTDYTYAVSPLEFIQYIAYSEGMVTCMFHGVMLGLAMQKQFRYVPQDPGRDKKIATTMNRLYIPTSSYYWNAEEEKLSFNGLDFNRIHPVYQELVNESVGWIRKMIEA